MNFYDFCRCITLEKKNEREESNDDSEPRLGTFPRFDLKCPHPLHDTHQLSQHTFQDDIHVKLVPRVVGMSIP